MSIPSRPWVTTRARADCAKVARFVGEEATDAKFWEAAPPPIERMVLTCGCLPLRARRAGRHPLVLSTSILRSAHSSES